VVLSGTMAVLAAKNGEKEKNPREHHTRPGQSLPPKRTFQSATPRAEWTLPTMSFVAGAWRRGTEAEGKVPGGADLRRGAEETAWTLLPLWTPVPHALGTGDLCKAIPVSQQGRACLVSSSPLTGAARRTGVCCLSWRVSVCPVLRTEAQIQCPLSPP
jgi:hypothetical protein